MFCLRYPLVRIVSATLVDAVVAVVVVVARGDAVVRAKESGRDVQGRAEVVAKAATKILLQYKASILRESGSMRLSE